MNPNIVAVQIASQKRRKRAVLYLRVSTLGQVNTDFNPEGISIPAQRVAGEKKAESLDADIVREFIEPGKTATSIDKRPVFQEMVAWVKAQKDIEYVIVYHFNRVSYRCVLEYACRQGSVFMFLTSRASSAYSTRLSGELRPAERMASRN